MKKFLTLAFTAALLLTACGNKEEEKNENNVANSTVVTKNKELTSSEKVSEKFIKIFRSGNYHMKSKISENDENITIETYKKDGMVATKIEDANEYQRMIVRDGNLHTINDKTKIIITTPARENDEYVDQTPETEGITYVTSGTADFDGKPLLY